MDCLMRYPKILQLTGLCQDRYFEELTRQVNAAIAKTKQKLRIDGGLESILKLHKIDPFPTTSIIGSDDAASHREDMEEVFRDCVVKLATQGHPPSFEETKNCTNDVLTQWLELAEADAGIRRSTAKVFDHLWRRASSSLTRQLLSRIAFAVKDNPLLCNLDDVRVRCIRHPQEFPAHLWLPQMRMLRKICWGRDISGMVNSLLAPWSGAAHVILALPHDLAEADLRLILDFLNAEEKIPEFADVLMVYIVAMRRVLASPSVSKVFGVTDWLHASPWAGFLLRLWQRLILIHCLTDSSAHLLDCLFEEEDQRNTVVEWTRELLLSLGWTKTL